MSTPAALCAPAAGPKPICALLQSRGATWHAAIRSLAFKWQRIKFRCWQTRQPYDDDRYLRQLHRQQSPLLQFLKPIPTT